jgi:hypothetical protein
LRPGAEQAAGLFYAEASSGEGYRSPVTKQRAALSARTAEAADDRLAPELATLAELQAAQMIKARAGDGPAADRVLAIMDRRAKLLGLYSQRPEADAPDYEDAERRLREKLNAMATRMKAEEKPTPE